MCKFILLIRKPSWLIALSRVPPERDLISIQPSSLDGPVGDHKQHLRQPSEIGPFFTGWKLRTSSAGTETMASWDIMPRDWACVGEHLAQDYLLCCDGRGMNMDLNIDRFWDRGLILRTSWWMKPLMKQGLFKWSTRILSTCSFTWAWKDFLRRGKRIVGNWWYQEALRGHRKTWLNN